MCLRLPDDIVGLGLALLFDGDQLPLVLLPRSRKGLFVLAPALGEFSLQARCALLVLDLEFLTALPSGRHDRFGLFAEHPRRRLAVLEVALGVLLRLDTDGVGATFGPRDDQLSLLEGISDDRLRLSLGGIERLVAAAGVAAGGSAPLDSAVILPRPVWRRAEA
ncbi:MAG: hypothetical protein ABI232_03325 [Jatrophihabitantaceae bacterium]